MGLGYIIILLGFDLISVFAFALGSNLNRWINYNFYFQTGHRDPTETQHSTQRHT